MADALSASEMEANVLQSASAGSSLEHDVHRLRKEVERLRCEHRQAVQATERIAASVGEHARTRQEAEARVRDLEQRLEESERARHELARKLETNERDMAKVEERVRVLLAEQERLADMVRAAEAGAPAHSTAPLTPVAPSAEELEMARAARERARLFGTERVRVGRTPAWDE